MNRNRAFNRKSRRSVAVVAISLAVTIITLLILFGKNWQGGLPWDNSEEDARKTITYEGKEYQLRDNVQTILIMGIDNAEDEASLDSYNNDKQADFLSLLVLDRDNNTVKTLQIDRDTMAEINILGVDGDSVGVKTAQLSLAYSYGSGKKDSCKNTVKAVSKFLYETPIDHYISITMDAASELNDMLGGVEVTILDDFTVFDKSLVKGETVLLNGKQALTYVRSRSDIGDETNVSRMKRQRQYIDALYKKLTKTVSEDKLFISKVGIKLSKYMVSDCTVPQLERIARFVSQYDTDSVVEIKGESKQGEQHVEFYPDESALRKQIVELFYEPK
ncbi:MAG: LCP family protein [Oscillospiraceae bacterium]|nr:LCP family protein [Oscillospiraceae bacterium]